MRHRQQLEEELLEEFVQKLPDFGINNQKNLTRNPGLLREIYMLWQKDQSTRFQFKEIYTHRLRTLKKAFRLEQEKTIQDLSNDLRGCELIGLFKRIEAKRVRAFEDDYETRYGNNQPLYSENDTYELEDETGKVKLDIRHFTKINGQGKFIPLETPYGVIVKCKGEYSPKINRFILSNVQTPKPAPQKPLISFKGEPKFMLVMCEPQISDLVRVFNFVRNSRIKNILDLNEIVIIGGVDYNDMNQIRQFDSLIYELGALVDTFIIPSSCEQNSLIYPLNPLPKSLLQKCFQTENIANCSNPQLLESKVQNTRLNTVISCGQNIRNLKANCNIQDELQLMKLTIEYRHLCPSSVFSLPIQSYKYDPLILESTPHLMIHGKCQIFQTEFWEREWDMQNVNVRLVGLAKGDFARINLTSNTLETAKWTL